MPSQPISARPSTRFAVVERHRDVVAVVLVVVDAAIVFQRDQIAAAAGLQEHAVDVGAMGNAVRLAEALDEFGVERHVGNEIAGQRIAHFLRRRAVCVGQHGVFEADFLQDAENVRPELDAGADFAEFGRLLEQPDRKSLVSQRIGGDQAADSAAGDQKGSGTTIRTSHGHDLTSRKPIMRRP